MNRRKFLVASATTSVGAATGCLKFGGGTQDKNVTREVGTPTVTLSTNSTPDAGRTTAPKGTSLREATSENRSTTSYKKTTSAHSTKSTRTHSATPTTTPKVGIGESPSGPSPTASSTETRTSDSETTTTSSDTPTCETSGYDYKGEFIFDLHIRNEDDVMHTLYTGIDHWENPPGGSEPSHRNSVYEAEHSLGPGEQKDISSIEAQLTEHYIDTYDINARIDKHSWAYLKGKEGGAKKEDSKTDFYVCNNSNIYIFVIITSDDRVQATPEN